MAIIPCVREGVTFFASDDPVWGEVSHGFSTRLGGVSPAPWDSLNLGTGRGDDRANVEENYRRFQRAIGCPQALLVKNRQIHSGLVRPVTAAHAAPVGEPTVVEADGLVTNEPGVALAAFSADCIPILFYDPAARCIAAVHAGWRGTAAGIAANAVQMMGERYGCDPRNIRAAIGPGISPCCFETHADVPTALVEGLGPRGKVCIQALPGEKFRVDLKLANALWLEEAGLPPQNIQTCPACTACEPHLFWSHRKVGDARGSMAALICL